MNYIDNLMEKLAPWLQDSVYEGKDSVESILCSLKGTIHEIMDRTRSSTLEEWTEQFTKRHESMGLSVSFNELGEKKELTQIMQNEISCVFQEACGNAVKHGKANKIQILVIYQDDRLQATIADNGIGIELEGLEGAQGGAGIGNMKARIAKLGGAFKVVNKDKDTGTVVIIDVPLLQASTDRVFERTVQIGHELHDILCPEMIGVVMMLANMKRPLSEDEAEKWYELNRAEEELGEFVTKFRTLSHELMV